MVPKRVPKFTCIWGVSRPRAFLERSWGVSVSQARFLIDFAAILGSIVVLCFWFLQPHVFQWVLQWHLLFRRSIYYCPPIATKCAIILDLTTAGLVHSSTDYGTDFFHHPSPAYWPLTAQVCVGLDLPTTGRGSSLTRRRHPACLG